MSLRSLQRLMDPRGRAESCELCRALLSPRHDHLIDPIQRKLACACLACALLFEKPGQRYQRVPKRVTFLPDFDITPAEWEALMIPIGLVFFFRSSVTGKVSALYPSPAGPVESLLPIESWELLASRNAVARDMAADVEALLVNRSAGECYLLPIDECYRLAGVMRSKWRGLSGGNEVWTEMRAFFAEMKGRALEGAPCPI
jgi:hypothetical protein